MLQNIKKQYCIAIIWYILSLIISNGNDIIQKGLGNNLHSIQLTFLRFVFGTLTLLPLMLLKYKEKSFYTPRPAIHIIRGALLFGGIGLWCYGLKIVDLTIATTINFTIPIFILILATFFLNENIGWARWIATVVGFLGIMIVLKPMSSGFDPSTLLLLLSAVMFAMLDVTNKKYVIKESLLAMLFYTALVTMLFGLVPSIYLWQTPTLQQYGLLMLLGIGANLILYCLLKAFKSADASAMAPFRYVELFLAALSGYYLFEEIPKSSTWIGAIIIIPSTLFIVCYDAKYSNMKK